MSTDPLAILDSPKITPDEEPLPFADEPEARKAEWTQDDEPRPVEREHLLLVRCDSCAQLFRNASPLLQAATIQNLTESDVEALICTDCVKAIDRRSYGMQPSDFPDFTLKPIGGGDAVGVTGMGFPISGPDWPYKWVPTFDTNGTVAPLSTGFYTTSVS